MNFYTKRFKAAFHRHLRISRDIGKHFMKVGKKETSVIISHKVEITDGSDAHLITTINLLPVRRMYNDGDEIVCDGYLLHEMQEDIEV